MSHSWKTVRVFISSTFRDMHAERDHLVKVTFPRLRQWCEERRLHLVDIDLRWGLTLEQSTSGKALEICLTEIDGSRPFFVCVLGNRYGWVPAPEEFPREAFERFAGLRPRTHCSITHLEIIHATGQSLESANPRPPCAHAFFYFRDPSCVPEPQTLAGLTGEQRHTYRETFFEQDSGRADMLAKLKRAIRSRCGGEDRVFDYGGLWDAAADNPEDDRLKGRLTHLEAFGDRVEKDLKRAIAQQFAGHLADSVATTARDPLAEERELHEAFIENRTQVHIPRVTVEKQLDDYLAGDDPRPLVLSGPPGSGKSSLLAHWAKIRRSRPQDTSGCVLARFIGASPASVNLQQLLRNLCAQLVQHFGLTEELPSVAQGSEPARSAGGSGSRPTFGPMEVPLDPEQLRRKWPTILQEAGKKGHVIVVLDALNQMDRSADPRVLDWLPSTLPARVRLIVSVLDHGPIVEAVPAHATDDRPDWLYCLRQRGLREIPVPPLSDADCRRLIQELPSIFCKTLDDAQTALLLENPATRNPLFLTVALEELRVFGSFAKLASAIKDLPRPDTAASSGDTEQLVEQMFGRVLDRLVRDTNRQVAGLVPVLFQLLACAREGLLEQEMEGLLARSFPQVAPDRRNGTLQVVLRQVRPYLMRKRRSHGALVDFYHRSFWKAVRSRYLSKQETRALRHRDLADYFTAQPYNLADGVPNERKLVELPWQPLQAACEAPSAKGDVKVWEPVEKLLCDLHFIDAKSRAGMVDDLRADYYAVLDAWPAEQGHYDPFDAQPIEPVPDWMRESVAAVAEARPDPHPQRGAGPVLAKLRRSPPASAGRSNGGEAPQVIPVAKQPLAEDYFGPDQGTSRTMELMRQAERETASAKQAVETPLSRVRAFAHFVHTQGHELARLPEMTFVLARNYASSGPVAESAEPLAEALTRPWIARESRPEPPPDRPLCVRVLHGDVSERAVAVSADGRLAVSAGGYLNGSRVWDLPKGQLRHALTNARDVVALTPDGKVAVTATDDNRVVAWDPASGEWIQDFEGHISPAFITAMTADGRKAVTGSRDSDYPVRVWDVASGRCLLKLYARMLDSVSISADGRLICATEGGFLGPKGLRVWNAETGQALWTLKGHKGNDSVVLSDNGLRAVSEGDNGVLHVWDLAAGRCVRVIRTGAECVRSVAVTADGRRAASVSTDGKLCLWDLDSGQCLTAVGCTESLSSEVALTPDGGRAVTRGETELQVWDLAAARKPRKTRTIRISTRLIISLSLSADGRLALTSDTDSNLCLWDLGSGRCLRTIAGEASGPHAAMSRDGRLAVSGGADGSVRFWDLSRGRLLRLKQAKKHDRTIRALAVTADGRLAVSGSEDKTLGLWDLRAGRWLRSLEGHEDYVQAVAVTPDGKLALSGSDDKTARLWDLATGKCLYIFRGHGEKVWFVALTPNGRLAFSRGLDQCVRVWDVATGRTLATLPSVGKVALTANGRLAVTDEPGRVSPLGAVRIWDVARLVVLREIEGVAPPDAVTADGRLAVSRSMRGVQVWDLATGQSTSRAKQIGSHSPPLAVTPDGGTAISLEEDGGITKLAVAPDGRLAFVDGSLAISPGEGNSAHLLETGSGHVLSTLKCATQVGQPLVSPDGVYAFLGGTQLWDLRKGRSLRNLVGAKGRIAVSADARLALTGKRIFDLQAGQFAGAIGEPGSWRYGHDHVAMTPDARIVALVRNWDRRIEVWDMGKGTCLHILDGHNDHITSYIAAPAISADGKVLVSADSARGVCIRVWDLVRGRCLHTFTEQANYEATALAVSGDGRLAVSSFFDRLKVWDLERGRLRQELQDRSAKVVAVGISADGRFAVSGGGGVIRWDLATGKSCPLRDRGGAISAVAISPDGNTVLSAHKDGTLNVWDLARGRHHTFHSRGKLTDLAYAPAARRVVFNCDGELRVLDLATGKLVQSITANMLTEDALRSGQITYTVDGTHLLCEGVLWNVATGRRHSAIDQLAGWRCLALVPDGRRVVTGDKDKLCLWDLASGQRLWTAETEAEVRSLDVTPDGRLAATRDYVRVYLWELDTGKCLAVQPLEGERFAAGFVPRNLPLEAPLVTAVRLFRYSTTPPEIAEVLPAAGGLPQLGHGAEMAGDFEETPSIGCPWCLKRSVVPAGILSAIADITKAAGLARGASPCLNLPEAAWQDSRLCGSCPHCRKPLRFNPFVIDQSQI